MIALVAVAEGSRREGFEVEIPDRDPGNLQGTWAGGALSGGQNAQRHCRIVGCENAFSTLRTRLGQAVNGENKDRPT